MYDVREYRTVVLAGLLHDIGKLLQLLSTSPAKEQVYSGKTSVSERLKRLYDRHTFGSRQAQS